MPFEEPLLNVQQTKVPRLVRFPPELAEFVHEQQVKGFDPPGEPHFDAETAKFFRTRLEKASLYLEFGSGGSTLWADRMGVETISIENDRFYAERVRSALSPDTKVTIISPELGITREWGIPVFLHVRKARIYVTAALPALGSRIPDLVLVDGRYRIATTLGVAHRVQQAGATTTIIVDDYFDRDFYRDLENWLGEPMTIGRSAVFETRGQRIPPRVIGQYFTDWR